MINEDELDNSDETRLAQSINSEVTLTLKDCLKSKNFWLLEIMMFMSVFYGYFIVNSYKVFALGKIEDEKLLNTIGAVASACASIRFTFGFMMEKWSFKICYTFLLIC